ncbi:RNA polymerase II C-terminal domain phosphatase-like 5 [Apium graveolens]|uniref:RNA polymerase II C-terminal domain phosphatase-like 5 n=1 Tax=Apium graveolens TaxID=4045 RepID=UPI003D7A5996
MGTQQITSDDDTTRSEICTQAALYAQIFYRVPLEIVRDVWIPNIMLQNLRNRKKLCLVLDLDQTLLHTKRVHRLSQEDRIRFCNSSQKNDISRWKSSNVEFLTKLRPFVRKFLPEASKLFDMYIYTNGSRCYAKKMAGLLDPDRVYFGSRIISREDSTAAGQKRLDVVPVHKSGVLILDDSEKAWARDLSNLIVIKQYEYFAAEDPNSPRSLSEEGTDESESSGPLSWALRLLQEVHRSYFEFNHLFDVNELLGVLVENNGIHEEKPQELGTGNSWCDVGSRKRSRVNDERSSSDVPNDVAKRQKR